MHKYNRIKFERLLSFSQLSIYKISVVLLIFFGIVSSAEAQLNPAHLSINYNVCENKMIVKFKFRDVRSCAVAGCCRDTDQMGWLEIKYVDGGVEKGLFLAYDADQKNHPDIVRNTREVEWQNQHGIDFDNGDHTFRIHPGTHCPYQFGFVGPLGTTMSLDDGPGVINQSSNPNGAIAEIPMPKFSGSSLVLKINGSWWVYVPTGLHSTTSSAYWSSGDFTLTTSNNSLNSTVTGLKVSNNECNYVALSWDNPTSYNATCPSPANPNWYNEVWRDGGTLKNVGKSNSYNDDNAIKGTTYDYQIRTFWRRNNYTLNTSDLTVPIPGKRLGKPDAPTLNEPTGICDAGEINLSWTTGLEAEGYIIERSTTNFNTIDKTITINSGTQTTEKDDGLTDGQIYDYRIRTVNKCGDISDPSNTRSLTPPSRPITPSNLTVSVDSILREINLSWVDQSTDETDFVVIRSFGSFSENLPPITSSTGSTTGSIITFKDVMIQTCKNYTYAVTAKNVCSLSDISNTQPAILNPILTNSFKSGSFLGSKGYYTDRVELQWTLGGNSANLLDKFKVSRRVLGSGSNYIFLDQFDATGIYNDDLADAGVLYQYQIYGFSDCGENGAKVYSDTAYTIGFRSKSGLVTGNVSYAGGNAVKDVKIRAESSEPSLGKSIAVNGGGITIDYNLNQNVISELILDSWIKPNSYTSDFVVAKKSGSYDLSYNHSQASYVFSFINNGTSEDISVSRDSFPVNDWRQIAIQVSDSIYMYRNGKVIAKKRLLIFPANFTNPSNIPIELYTNMQGNAMEFRFWNKRKNKEEIFNDASRFAAGIEKGLVCYLPMSEGFGDFVYDRSKSAPTTFNKNDGALVSGSVFDTEVPSIVRLSHGAITDTSGNYLIYLPYTNLGENYELTPVFFPHEFSPIKRLLYIGDGSSVINNIDFIDNSSFEMTGSLFYEGTTCPVKDAFLKIDGELVQIHGSFVKTDDFGQFRMDVPIGNHYIEIEKHNHTFSAGRYPLTEGTAHDFQESVSGREFFDNTSVRLVGRAVGGSREAEKIPVIGKSVNNIGITEITLKRSNCGWETGITAQPIRFDTTIITDSVTGVYDVQLPPWLFTVDKLKRKNELVTPQGFFGPSQEPIDLRNDPEDGVIQVSITEYDTTFANLTNDSLLIDTINFNKEVNFVHFSKPSIDVVNMDESPFLGEKKYVFSHSKYGSDTVNLVANMFDFPILYSAKKYNVLVKLFEEYKNIDIPNAVGDRIPIIRGKLNIDNKLAVDPVYSLSNELDTLNGSIPYEFIVGQPALLESVVDPGYSFTKIFNIEYLNPKGVPENWKPFTHAIPLGKDNPSDNYRAYIFGGKTDPGTNHAVQGPNEIEYILRDPPVGGASATLEKGSKTTEFTKWSINAGGGVVLNTDIKLGPKLLVGIGKISSINVENTLQFEFDNESKFGKTNNTATVTEYTKTVTTSSIPNNVGDGSDLFMGTSSNYLFGTSTDFGLYPDMACDDGAAKCYGPSLGGYKLGKSRNYEIGDKTLATEFILSKTDIEVYEIPYLMNLRDQLLKHDTLYKSTITDTLSQFYGVNNDNMDAFGGNACRCYHWEPRSTPPPSYQFLGHRDSLDQVRKFNEDINNWKRALEANERDKALSTKKIKNFTFDGGGSSVSLSEKTSSVISNSFTWEVNFTEKIKQILGAELDGVGFDTENSINLTQSTTGEKGTETDLSTTVTFNLTDEDIWDRYSVDVFESAAGWGPIFKVRSGETSCPHVGPVISRYHVPGTVLSVGTVQLEQPRLAVDNPIRRNVPEDEVAEFVFRLGNDSKEGWAYTLGLLNHTNSGGAIIVNSGTSELGSDFVIGSGQEISQVIQIVRGGAYDHDSLLFVLASSCQYDLGNDFDDDIGDSVYVSAFFVPGCTDISINEPNENWVLNTSFNDEMEIILSDYDVNSNNFKSFTLEYKPSSEPDWIALNTYFLHPADTLTNAPANFEMISSQTNSTGYLWKVAKGSYPDTEYDLRVVADCVIATSSSEVVSGYMDRQRIEVFGTPSPADGILDPDDDILITMNETIEAGGVTPDVNFDIRGVKNGSPLGHETSLQFDGNGDYAMIPEYQLQQRSLSIEFWIKRNRTGEEIIISQGSPNDELSISFNSDNNVKFQLGASILTSNVAIADQSWHHVAVAYDRKKTSAQIIIDFAVVSDDVPFGSNYSSTGAIYIGKDATGSMLQFDGLLHEMRLWSIPRTFAQVSQIAQVSLSGRESGLIGNWPFDEGYGSLAFEKVRRRHATIIGASWNILPQNHAFGFDGIDDYLKVPSTGALSFDDASDLTLEGWFKTDATKEQTIFCNGKGDGSRPSSERRAWNIFLNASGALVAQNNGMEIISPARTDVVSGYNDQIWHHFSIVVERTRAISLYMDGDLVATGNASSFNGFSGPSIWVGARAWKQSAIDTIDNYFDGALDEIRIWKLARKSQQIKRDFVHQLIGDELGLAAYYTFDGIKLESGVLGRVPDLRNVADTSKYSLNLGGSTVLNYTTNAPPVKLPRLVEKVNFTYSINNDRIFIEITDPPASVENVTLDITVEKLRDLAGNFMLDGETWIAYINKNQVFWQDEYFAFEKKLEDELTFTSKIKNTGGSQERFVIDNLPTWLSASPSGGLIEPNSTIEVTFTVQSLLNIGEYEQDIFVRTESFGFNERLLLDLKVVVDPPDWKVDVDAFSGSMNITGEFKINGVISTDPEDMVSVWVNGELRGVTHVEYDPSSGKNLVFLTILSNAGTIDPPPVEPLEFRAWDASRGRMLIDLEPSNFAFLTNQILGSRTTPISIEATVLTELEYVMSEGWNWISFPLASADLSSAPGPLGQMSADQGNVITNRSDYLERDQGKWEGNLSSYNTMEAYKVKVAKADTFYYSGTFMDPSTEPISIINGWNWISVKSEFIIDVPSAMASLDPQTGDLIKGQRSFAIYEDGFGWGGNLDFLEPQKGYMLKYHQTDQLTFPGNLNIKPKDPVFLKSLSSDRKRLRSYKSAGYVPGTFGTTMSLTAKIDACLLIAEAGDDINLSDWEMSAYVGTECRGVVGSTWESSINTYLYYLSIEGDQTVALNFKLIHSTTGQVIELSQTMDYTNNSFSGTPSSPVLFTCKGGDCDDNLLYKTTDIDASQTDIIKRASIRLQSDAILPSGIRLVLKAGNHVEMLHDFEIGSNARLEVYIEDCENTNN